MKPADFEYHRPVTVAEAVLLLDRYAENVKVLAGGQSLIPAMNMRLARPQVLVDINRISELGQLRQEGADLAIGATVRHAEVERSELVWARQPLLAEAVRLIGHRQIRSRGTICGSLAHADPAAELPAVWAALDGRFRLESRAGSRWVGWQDFFCGYFTTAIGPDELMTEVRLPVMPPATGWAFVELARREGDFALVGIACSLSFASDGSLGEVRLALTGVGGSPVRAWAVEQSLRGKAPEESTWRSAAAMVQEIIDPDSDIHGSGEYRRRIAGVLTRRALELAKVRVQADRSTEGRDEA